MTKLLLCLISAAATAGTLVVEVRTDTLWLRGAPGRILVPVPRLCRASGSATGPAEFEGEAVEAGVAAAAFRLRGAAGDSAAAGAERLDVGYEPLDSAGRRVRMEQLRASREELPAGLILRTAEHAVWYGSADTNLALFFGGPAPADFEFGELAGLPFNADAVVLAFVGGWGWVPLDSTDDLAPAVHAMRDSLTAWGLRSIIVAYHRVPDMSPWGKVMGLTEMFGLHLSRGRVCAREIAALLASHPRMHVVLIGLSNGATFIGEAMNLLPEAARPRAHAIEMGPPFWHNTIRTPGILLLDNRGRDPLPSGDVDLQVAALLDGLWRYIPARLSGRRIKFEEVYYTPGHDYSWPTVGASVVAFLRERLGLRGQSRVRSRTGSAD